MSTYFIDCKYIFNFLEHAYQKPMQDKPNILRQEAEEESSPWWCPEIRLDIKNKTFKAID